MTIASLVDRRNSSSLPTLALLTGSGTLPLLLAQTIQREGKYRLVAVAHRDETDPALVQWVDHLCWVKLGQFNKIMNYLADQGVQRAILAGGIRKATIWRLRPDLLALRIAARLPHLNDDLLLRALAEELEKRGITIHGVTDFIPDLLAARGILSQRAPNAEQWQEIQLGWRAAKVLGALDIGQGVVVRERIIVAVEAIEGTDAMIQRAGELISGQRGHGTGTLVKVAKPQQDRRLDLPTVGPRTVENLDRAGIRVLALEAGSALLLEPQTTLALADRLGMVVVACTEEDLNRVDPDSPATGMENNVYTP